MSINDSAEGFASISSPTAKFRGFANFGVIQITIVYVFRPGKNLQFIRRPWSDVHDESHRRTINPLGRVSDTHPSTFATGSPLRDRSIYREGFRVVYACETVPVTGKSAKPRGNSRPITSPALWPPGARFLFLRPLHARYIRRYKPRPRFERLRYARARANIIMSSLNAAVYKSCPCTRDSVWWSKRKRNPKQIGQ